MTLRWALFAVALTAVAGLALLAAALFDSAVAAFVVVGIMPVLGILEATRRLTTFPW